MLILLSSLLFARPPRGNAEDNFAELEDKFVLHFHNAVSGDPIAGATIIFEGTKKKTKSNGTVQFDFPFDLEDGEDTRSVRFIKNGFTKSDFDIPFQVGSLWFNRFSVSPQLSLKKLRIVLDWGDDPRDLDAHLIQENQYHISYRNKTSIVGQAELDRDDLDGHGPETITLHNIDPSATYKYFVHDYSNNGSNSSTKLSNSGARIHIYSSSGREKTLYVPKEKIGNEWSVFRIQNGEIIPEQLIYNK
jgi:uncharacterized protein YfaP (DUF2135 family)